MHVKSIRRLKQKKEAAEAQQKDLEAQKRVGEGCGAHECKKVLGEATTKNLLDILFPAPQAEQP